MAAAENSLMVHGDGHWRVTPLRSGVGVFTPSVTFDVRARGTVSRVTEEPVPSASVPVSVQPKGGGCAATL